MNAITMESLGFTKEELAERVIDRVATMMLETSVADENGDPTGVPSQFSHVLEKRIAERIDAAIDTIAGKHVLPNVATYVENLCLQETNKWGERVGKPVTFTEYLVKRAEAYLTEEVDFDGRAKGERDSFGWRKAGTRVSYLVHQHLQYSIETAMKQALTEANTHIVEGIEKAVKIKLGEVAASLKVAVSTKG